MTREFTLIVHEEEGQYWAEVAELPGCYTQGDTLDELRENIVEAIELWMEDTDRLPESRVTLERIAVSV